MTELFVLKFQRKFTSFQELCKSLSFRAACQIQTRKWNKDKTIPKDPPAFALVDYANSDERWIFFEYCDEQYNIRLWSFREDARGRIVGYCSVYRETDLL